MKIIIAGSRQFKDYNMLVKAVNRIINREIKNYSNKIEIVSGNARGADTLGENFAKENKFDIKLYPADWNSYGKSSGYIRNEQMAKYGEVLIAFWDMKSNGTRHMINLANKYNLKVYVIDYNNRKILENYK